MDLHAASLVAEIDNLKQRLEEVEDLRRAIVAGEVDAFVVGATDESKRVLMLSGAYMRYRQLVEDMQQGAVTLARGGEILFANHAFAQMAGLQPLDLFRTRLSDHLVGAPAEVAEALARPRNAQPDAEVRLRRRGGELKVRFSLVSSSDDFVTYIVTDLTEAISPEEALETVHAIRNGDVDALVLGGERVVMMDGAQALYQAAVDRMHQGAAMTSADGRVVYVNQRFASMAALPRERILGRELAALFVEADRARVAEALRHCSTAGSRVEASVARSNGAPLGVTATLFSMPDGRCMCLFTDTSEHRRHVEADTRNRKFLGMLAHEFRNMLGPIRNSVELLKLARLDPQLLEAVETIERQSSRMLQLVEDLRVINPRD